MTDALFKIAYFGSPDFSAHVLKRIIDELPNISVDLVVTQPDRPLGRKHVLTPTAVKKLSLERDLKIRDNNFENDLKDIDLALVFAFGKIIPENLLSCPKFGFVNIHPSSLPLYRGPSPLVFPIMLNNSTFGVSLMKMDFQMDHGPIILQKQLPIEADTTHDQLLLQASDMGFELFKQFAENISIKLQEQNHNKATFTKLLKRDDGFIEASILKKALQNKPIKPSALPNIIQWYFKRNRLEINLDLSSSGRIIYNVWRAMHPWPGIWTLVNNKRVKILKCKLINNQLLITEYQIEGSNPQLGSLKIE